MPALTAGDDREKSGLQLQIAAIDRAIDSLVFRLYDLNAAEETAIRQAKGGYHESKHD